MRLKIRLGLSKPPGRYPRVTAVSVWEPVLPASREPQALPPSDADTGEKTVPANPARDGNSVQGGEAIPVPLQDGDVPGGRELNGYPEPPESPHKTDGDIVSTARQRSGNEPRKDAEASGKERG
jgi:hypothetical protein